MKTLLLLATFAAAFPALAKETHPEYTAHEWGTFTSVQGADGAQVEWNPFVVWDLPNFVQTSLKPAGVGGNAEQAFASFAFGKSGVGIARQRMETPVIYFYADQSLKVDVGVRFPGGQLTEWYPALTPQKAAATAPGANYLMPRQTLNWNGVEVLPGADLKFPSESTANHYYAARNTDAAPLRVQTSDGAQNEKFLFYRGVGSFVAPLNVVTSGPDQFHLRSTQQNVLIADAFIYIVRGDQAVMERLPRIADTDQTPTLVTLDFAKKARPLAEVRTELGTKMRSALTAAGLFEKESAAMVQTWDDSWFGEQGTRILYILPRAWADTVLPLTFSPAPKKLERVFVGRAEIFTAAQEWTVMKAIMRNAEGRETDKAAASSMVKETLLGRFADAVVRKHTAANAHLPAFQTAGFSLLETLRPKKETKVAAK